MGIYTLVDKQKKMGKSKYISRHLLPSLPNPAITLINRGLSSLWEIEPIALSDDSIANYLFRLNKTEFWYLNSNGLPLPIKPDKIGELKIIDCIDFEDYEDTTDKIVRNLFSKV